MDTAYQVNTSIWDSTLQKKSSNTFGKCMLLFRGRIKYFRVCCLSTVWHHYKSGFFIFIFFSECFFFRWKKAKANSELFRPPLQHSRGICVIQKKTARQKKKNPHIFLLKNSWVICWIMHAVAWDRQRLLRRGRDFRLQWMIWPFLSWKINWSDMEHMQLYLVQITKRAKNSCQ